MNSISEKNSPETALPELCLIPKKGGLWSKAQKVALAILILGGAAAIGFGLIASFQIPITIGVSDLTFSFAYFGSDILAYFFPRIQK